ncbi:MAG: MBL fold hydrolase [Cyclobacteriaceae bacterium]|nr:MAG: MBL fold hydrolase [Cyclobacteriaceae bacterium]
MLQLESFVFGPFQENTYVLYDDNSGDGIILDPGCYQDHENQQLLEFVTDNRINITKIVNTHCHIDHVLGNEFAKVKFNAPLAIPEGEQEVYRAVKSYAPVYGFPKYKESEIDEFIDESDVLRFGEISLEIMLVPGHSPGHLAFYHKDSKICIGGDVLFQGSIGRTDLPGGDHQTLINSIHTKMFLLPDDVTVYCGHGPPTTIGEEKKSNPFCALV